ncbi:putative glycolipid-binding domain-containing protein [Chromobacterium aquaticum]|uniref:Glycolipid-binding domain-containing protein n=1 Tax=Chromobacterium aquaticum TaxID=467180 RepID=A0ABV8ZQA3_9NEIS|nr:putative glycolipid-binding domain-containing protein [Chromobacterium aquaticum]MCD5364464.1 putative glycolipid-binding domain-containing protein [Chromobacterium aquaticum]
MHDITQHQAIIWQRLDASGHDYAALETSEHGPRLSGCAIFVEDGINCLLHYQVDCAPDWSTRRATIQGYRGGQRIELLLEADAERRWLLNGVEQPQVQGCVDIDLAFTPATNLLPIRRGRLEIGAALELSAAWLQFPALTLAPLPQRYTRLSELGYRYESRQGAFQAEISVTPDGLPRDYQGLWREAR